jgi:hypothetical protein
MADNEIFSVPATIDDPDILNEIAPRLNDYGYGSGRIETNTAGGKDEHQQYNSTLDV